MNSDIYSRYLNLLDEIRNCTVNSGRQENSVMLLPVSKTVPADVISHCADLGMKLFAENRIQEAESKFVHMKGDFRLHLIGHLQSNKSRTAVQLFDMIHSIDKLSTAEKLNSEAEKAGKTQNILVQVNTSGEVSKSGCTPDTAEELCAGISALKNLKLKGLMTIGPLTENKKRIAECFQTLRILKEKISSMLQISLPELSMGMSDDYEIAIKEGSTIVRIGSAIFGSRN
ncbi:MAG: YggS family pyridoxal phosphate-dependent enzyme [Spirochaetes bacterium]|nr:YggS family pyridoxal phosphate-dependent enzyme [Spirochaetota bacterium]